MAGDTRDDMTGGARVVHTADAPAAIGPYSQGIVRDGWLYTAGQIGLVPGTGALVSPDVGEQAEQVFVNLAAVLTAAGAGFRHVVKATVYLVDMDDFATVNEIYGRHVEEPHPARSTVAVASLPKGARVEIDLVARIP
ncbi:MAG TPA: RidA family protein [Gemmatimonadota bacterium]|nr:RidA family protein [Gemmatimonadota bacterium]